MCGRGRGRASPWGLARLRRDNTSPSSRAGSNVLMIGWPTLWKWCGRVLVAESCRNSRRDHKSCRVEGATHEPPMRRQSSHRRRWPVTSRPGSSDCRLPSLIPDYDAAGSVRWTFTSSSGWPVLPKAIRSRTTCALPSRRARCTAPLRTVADRVDLRFQPLVAGRISPVNSPIWPESPSVNPASPPRAVPTSRRGSRAASSSRGGSIDLLAVEMGAGNVTCLENVPRQAGRQRHRKTRPAPSRGAQPPGPPCPRGASTSSSSSRCELVARAMTCECCSLSLHASKLLTSNPRSLRTQPFACSGFHPARWERLWGRPQDSSGVWIPASCRRRAAGLCDSGQVSELQTPDRPRQGWVVDALEPVAFVQVGRLLGHPDRGRYPAEQVTHSPTSSRSACLIARPRPGDPCGQVRRPARSATSSYGHAQDVRGVGRSMISMSRSETAR